jgi:2-polyprenyl-6-methoxyphenol hydroxylase-like FAD-dependent oxidoreductase
MPQRPNPSLTIIIVGAGIGSLSLALRLAQTDHWVRVYERQSDLSPKGGRVASFPSFIRVLDSWGLTDEFRGIVDVIEKTEVRRSPDGEVLRRIWREEGKGRDVYVFVARVASVLGDWEEEEWRIAD